MYSPLPSLALTPSLPRLCSISFLGHFGTLSCTEGRRVRGRAGAGERAARLQRLASRAHSVFISCHNKPAPFPPFSPSLISPEEGGGDVDGRCYLPLSRISLVFLQPLFRLLLLFPPRPHTANICSLAPSSQFEQPCHLSLSPLPIFYILVSVSACPPSVSSAPVLLPSLPPVTHCHLDQETVPSPSPRQSL